MDDTETIRTHYPHHIAKLHESLQLENNASLRVFKLLDLFEDVVRSLALVGLAYYRHAGLHSEPIEQAQIPLERPSLGHWVALFKCCCDALLPEKSVDYWVLSPAAVEKSGPLADGITALGKALGVPVPAKIRHRDFLDLMVQYRNKRKGHGSLPSAEAAQMLPVLEAALTDWLTRHNLFTKQRLVYVRSVEFKQGGLHYRGVDLNAGLALPPYTQPGQASGVEPERVYLYNGNRQAFIPLHPLFYFDESQRLFVFHELEAGAPVVYCPYDATGMDHTRTLPAAAWQGLHDAGVGPDDSGDVSTGAVEKAPVSQPQPQPSAPAPGQTRSQPAPSRPTQQTQPSQDVPIMRNWFDIIRPHEDIRKGDFNEAVFAADLGDVHAGRAPVDYNDPYTFFKKTYLTDGLQTLLHRVHRKLTEGAGASVVQIQTPFGGGKTHSLVTLYHYLKNGDRVRELLPKELGRVSPNICVVNGEHWNVVTGMSSNGVTRYTLWGELAYQIGGAEGYEAFRRNDEQRITPGKADLLAFLQAHQPFILLFDEVLEYINKALDLKNREQVDVSLGTQTFSFFQELTDAVAALPKGMLVVTLPSSHLEDFGEQQEESLARLSKIFGRVETIETPVKGEEIYAVIRRRLFEVESLKEPPMREVVHSYFTFYQRNEEHFPVKTREMEFKQRMELAYPFHPDLIDILYEKWGTFSSFQRTRGVLRLLAGVIEDLYKNQRPADLILPGDLPLDFSEVREEFIKHIGREYESIIGSDIAGHEAKSRSLDDNHREWKRLAQRIGTAIFFHSFSADDPEKGASVAYVKLAVLRSNEYPALVSDVLQRLSHVLWYLNSRGEVYYFSRIPNLNRMILDKKELYNEAYEEEMKRIINAELGNRFRRYLWERSSDAIADNRELKLVVLHPLDSEAVIGEWLERKGNSFREYKNTLLFTVADSAAFAQLREDVKTLLALQEIDKQIKENPDTPLARKSDEVRDRLHGLRRDFSDKVRRMYHVVYKGKQRYDFGQPAAGTEGLSNWFWRELKSTDVGAIVEQLHYRMVVNKMMGGNEQVPTVAVLDQFYKNMDLPALSEQGVLARAIQLGVQDRALGLVAANGGELDPTTVKFDQTIPLDAVSFDADEYLITGRQAEALLAQIQTSIIDEPPSPPSLPEGGGEDGQRAPTPGVAVGPDGANGAQPGATSYQRVRLVIDNVSAGRIADVNRGILMPIKSAAGEFSFTLEIDVACPEGMSQSTLDTKIKETIRQIGAVLREEWVE